MTRSRKSLKSITLRLHKSPWHGFWLNTQHVCVRIVSHPKTCPHHPHVGVPIPGCRTVERLDENSKAGHLDLSSAVFILIAFLPSVLGVLDIFAEEDRVQYHDRPQLSKREVHALGRNGEYKQEILLFGLADWVIGKWRETRDFSWKRVVGHPESLRSLLLGVGKDSVESVGYVSFWLFRFSHNLTL